MSSQIAFISWLERLGKINNETQCKVDGEVANIESGFSSVRDIFLSTKASDATIWWVGNGGSAAACSHLSQDVLNKLGIRSSILNDFALATCMANDYGYSQVFTRPLSVMAKKGDTLVAISSSGNSENILETVKAALDKNMKIITLSGFSEKNKLWQEPSNAAFYLPWDQYGLVEIGHEALLHAIIECMIQNLEEDN